MPNLAELVKLKQNEKENLNIKSSKPSEKPKTPAQFITIKIPMNLDDIRIAKLRTLYADIFGKEPPHDREHGKEWIANKINNVLSY